MAKSKRSRAAVHNYNCNGANQIKPIHCANNVGFTQKDIDRHWEVFPNHVKDFILRSSDGYLSIIKLIKYWSSPQSIQFTRGDLAVGICGTIWHLALVYLKLDMFNEAQALTINGSFLHQCYNSSIEYIISVVPADGLKLISENELPYFIRGLSTIGSRDEMKAHIEIYVPKDFTQEMNNFSHWSFKENRMGFIDHISDDWSGTSGHCHRSSSAGNDAAHKIKLIMVDDANEAERHSFGIGSSATLKSLFNEYADKRAISLRSLRFSFAGKILFLSSAGHKTPEELGIQDQDVIKVHDTSKPRESIDDDNDSNRTRLSTLSPISNKMSKDKRSKKAKKGKKIKSQKHQEEYRTKNLEEHKVEHSKRLTKIHDEAQAQFKRIRQRLNNLIIERSPRKVKSKRPRSPELEPTIPPNPTKEGTGGKAGKSRYKIQVGEVQNLYKTSKPSAMANNTSLHLPSLDLHGYKRHEALAKLDESLKVWVEMAMQGSYPFVQPAEIVCGCGNQILSETVQDWIRSNSKVSNAPKVRPSRGMML